METMEISETTSITWKYPPKNGLTAYFTKETFHKYIPEETFNTKLLKQLESFDVLSKTKFTPIPEVKTKEKKEKEKRKVKAELESKETCIKEEISQNEADKNESENGNKNDSRLNPSTTGNNCKSENAKSKQKAKQSESSTVFSETISSLPGSGQRYQSQSSQHHPNKKSCLSQQEQRSYLDLYDKYGSHIPADPTEEERAELRHFTTLKAKVSQEQSDFQAYLKKLAQKCVADYKFILPCAKKYIQDKIENGKKEVEKYPRHYGMVDSVSLIADAAELQSAIRLNYVSPLLCLGQVPKVQLPNMSTGIHPLVPTDLKIIQEHFPMNHSTPDANGTWNHETCSKDSNAEFLAVHHGCQVVISSSALSCLVDNQDAQLNRMWELPVHIKEHESLVNGQIVKHKVVYFDKPVQQSSLTIQEKSTWFHKYGLKMLVVSSLQKGQVFSNTLQPSKWQKRQPSLKEIQGQGISKCGQGRNDDFVQQPDSGEKNKVKESKDSGKPLSDYDDPFAMVAQNMDDLETFGASTFSPRRTSRSSRKHNLTDKHLVNVKKEDKTDYDIRKKDKPGSNSGEFFCLEADDVNSFETLGEIKTFSGDMSRFTNQGRNKEHAGEVRKKHVFQTSEIIERSSEELMVLKTCLMQQSVKLEGQEELFTSVSSAVISPTENKFQTDANRSAFTSIPAKQGAEIQEEQVVKDKENEIKNDIRKEISIKDSDLNLSTEDSDEEDKLFIACDSHEESNLENQSSIGSLKHLQGSASKPYVKTFDNLLLVDTPQSPTGDSPSSPVILTPHSPMTETTKSPQKDSSASLFEVRMQRETCIVIPLERQSDTDTGDEAIDSIGNTKKRQKFSHILCDHSGTGKDLLGTSFISDYSLRPLTRWQSPRRQQNTHPGNKDNSSAMPGPSDKNSGTFAGTEVTTSIANKIGRRRIAHQKSVLQDNKEGSDIANKEGKKSSVELPSLSNVSEIHLSPRVLRSTSRKIDGIDSQSALVGTVRKSARKRVTRTSVGNVQWNPDSFLNVMEEKHAEVAMELVSKEDVSPPKRKRGRPPKKKVASEVKEKDNETITSPLNVTRVLPDITSLVVDENKVQTTTSSCVQPVVSVVTTSSSVQPVISVVTTSSSVQPVVSVVTSGQKVTLPAYGTNKDQSVSSQEQNSEKIYTKKDLKQVTVNAEAINASPLDAIMNLQQKMLGIPSDGVHASTTAIPADETGNFKHPRNHNVTYHLWTLGTYRILIRCGYHGILREPQYSQSHYVHICPKLEYQLSFGLEQSSVSEVARNWIGLYIRPNCQLLRARINAFTSEVVVLEEQDIQRVIPLTSTFKPALAFLVLQRLLSVLIKCPAGQYLIVHTPGESSCKILKGTEGNKRGSYDLHFKHLGFMTGTASSTADLVQWNPIDTNLFLPQHRWKGRIPATYTPQGFTNEKFKLKKKKKGKRKQKKNK